MKEIGYRLSPDYWGRGLATEAAKVTRDRAFDRLESNNIVSIIQRKATVLTSRVFESFY
ncbi:MAG: GNAT family N-acetyltransferase [Prochloraceae cyanobacterium]|nr:GNAT family N-acetyltransferase [Prochloraceae cyanobacterium]